MRRVMVTVLSVAHKRLALGAAESGWRPSFYSRRWRGRASVDLSRWELLSRWTSVAADMGRTDSKRESMRIWRHCDCDLGWEVMRRRSSLSFIGLHTHPQGKLRSDSTL